MKIADTVPSTLYVSIIDSCFLFSAYFLYGNLTFLTVSYSLIIHALNPSDAYDITTALLPSSILCLFNSWVQTNLCPLICEVFNNNNDNK